MGPHERNYHVFYYLLAAIRAGDSKLSKYDLQSDDPLSFRILGEGPFDIQDFNGDVIDEAEHFDQLYSALQRSGFAEDEIENITDVIMAILYLGNVVIEGDEKAVIQTNDELIKAAELLKVDAMALERSILKKTVKYPGQMIEVDLSCDDAKSARESLIK